MKTGWPEDGYYGYQWWNYSWVGAFCTRGLSGQDMYVIREKNLIQTTFYFKFYLFAALQHCGLGETFISQLNPWRRFIELGLSTFPEDDSERPRSDCHPWSASPCYYLLCLTAGIRPAEPGFTSVIISPHFAELRNIHAVYPHPSGDIVVELTKKEKVRGSITLPDNLDGIFEWQEKTIALNPGMNVIEE